MGVKYFARLAFSQFFRFGRKIFRSINFYRTGETFFAPTILLHRTGVKSYAPTILQFSKF